MLTTIDIPPEALEDLVERVASAVAAKLAELSVIPARQVETDCLALPTNKAAAVISVSPRLLWSLTAPRGPIRSVKAGSRVLYPVVELRRWLEAEQTQTPVEESEAA